MTYTDHYQYDTTILSEDFKRLRDASLADKPALFVAYCRKAIEAKATGAMPMRDAAYGIAGVMFMKELSDPMFEDIVGLAGELELPAEFVSGDPEQMWQGLITLIDRYDQTFQSAAWLKEVEAKQGQIEQRTKEAFERKGE